ncbi:hypothetical protein [Gordonia sp. MP11Mi]
MKSTTSTPPAVRRPPGFREASMHDLFVDCCRLGPAPTRSREVFVIVTTAILLAVVFVVVRPSPLFIVAVSVVVVGFMGARWTVGERKHWNAR